MIHVLVRSKRTLSAELLSAAVSAQPHLKLVKLVETDEELLNALETQGGHIVLFMLEQTVDERWAESMKAIRDKARRVKLIVLTENRNPEVVVRAFSAGARGYFSLHDSSLDSLVKCIERVHDGQIWANSNELEWVIQALERTNSASKPFRVVNAVGKCLLSQREEDVVRLLVEGLQNREIAHALNLSEHTIKNYLFRIYDKLGISSRTELLLYVMTPRATELRQVS